MRIYSQIDEENVRDQGLVRDWLASGLLNADQASVLESDLSFDLRRTNPVLRAVLFLFTGLIVLASVGLTLVLGGFNLLGPGRSVDSAVFAIWAGITFALAWFLAKKGRLYRCGAEEALIVASAILFMLSVSWWTWEFNGVMACAAGALFSFGVYSLFGFRYAIVAATVLAGMIPFSLPWRTDDVVLRIFSIMILSAVFLVSRAFHQLHRGDIEENDWAAAKVTAFGGIYFVLNFMVPGRFLGLPSITSGAFYWGSYILIWILPAFGLWLGIRERDRLLIDTSSLAALVTLLTNKSYLGLAHETWDPILLGILLMGTAIVLRRWLASGVDGERRGFTSKRVLESENRVLAAASAVSLALPHSPSLSSTKSSDSTEPPKMKQGGGQSGGGGASGSF